MEWIKCSERLPERAQDIWLFLHIKDEDPVQFGSRLRFGGDDDPSFHTNHTGIHCGLESVSHWMPIEKPQPPKEDEK